MDPTSCPNGFAQDSVFDFYVGGFCAQNLVAFWVALGLIALIRTCACIVLVAARRKQWKAQKQKSAVASMVQPQNTRERVAKKKSTQRWIIGILFLCLDAFLAWINVILPGLNITGVKNAIPWSIYAISVSLKGMSLVSAALYSVRTSRALLPAIMNNSPTSQLLEKFDGTSVVFVACMLISVLTSQAVLAIAAPILAATGHVEKEIPLAQVGLVFQALFLASLLAMTSWQRTRCIHAIEAHVLFIQSNLWVHMDTEAKERAQNQLNGALQKLRRGRLINLLFLVAPLYQILLASRGIPWAWWVVNLSAWFHSFASFTEAFFAGGKYSLAAIVFSQVPPKGSSNFTSTSHERNDPFRTDEVGKDVGLISNPNVVALETLSPTSVVV